MTKVLHVYRTYFPDPVGGMQEAIRQICLATSGLGVENTIFSLSPSPHPSEIIFPEATVIRAKSHVSLASCDIGGLDSFIQFKKLSKQADLIHYLFPWPYADVLHLLASGNTPAVMTYVSDVVRQKWLGRIYSPLMSKMICDMKAIVANSPAYAETSSVLNTPAIKNKLRIIPLGIVEGSYPQAVENEILAKNGLSDHEPYFLFIGVLRYYKGTNFLVQAVKNIDAKLVIAGSGPEITNLKELVSKQNIQNVVFLGEVTDQVKIALIKSCMALILPSHLRSEAFGMVLVEASMYGKPMISCEIGTGTSYVNQNNVTGLVVPPASVEALRGAILLMLCEHELRKKMGVAARSRYEQLFSGAALGVGYSQLYNDVLSAI